MVQLILAVGVTVALVLFAMANTHHVELFYVLGEPVRMRLIFLLSIAFVSGSVLTVLFQLTGRVVRRARERERQMWLAAHAREELEEE